MKKPNLKELAIDTMVIINAAITNIRLYPPSSNLIKNSIDKAYSTLISILEQADSMVLAESEKNLLISGELLSEKDQKKPQVVAILDLLLSFGIKSLAFEKGLEKEELSKFLDILSRQPEDLDKEGGLHQVVEGKNLTHILLDQKVYVSIDKDQQIIASQETKDREIERRSGERRQEYSTEYFTKGGGERRKSEDKRIKQLSHIKAGINRILKGEDAPFEDQIVMRALPIAVRKLFSKRNYKAAEEIIDKLCSRLLSEISSVRTEASQVLSHIGTNLVDERQMDVLSKVSRKLALWTKSETLLTPDYELICSHLQKLAQNDILNHQFAETGHILEVFHLIYTGKIKKDEKIRSLSGNTLKAIASVDVLNMLLKELLINEEQKQNEAVNCLAMLGATSVDPLPDILLGIRSISENDRVAQFIPQADTAITSDESEALQEKICIALGRIGSQGEIPEIESTVVQESLLNIKSYNPKVQAAVKSALEMIKMEQAEKEKISPPEQNEIIPAIDSETITSEKTEPVTDDLHRQLLVVDGYVQQNDTESAVKLLFDLIVKYAKEKNFTNAESLREKLFEVDAMALTEIVSSGEIIEEEKSQSIDQDHLDVWPELYEPLTGEESNAFYYSMKEAEYDTDQTIIQQGELNSNLYFINQGQLKMVYRQGEREILLGTSNAGDIVGADTFFSVSVCTTSVITLSHVKLTFLENKILSKWKSDFPALGSKLRDFCMKKEKTPELLKKKDMDRRSHKRVPISGKVLFQLLEASGTPIGKVIKGNLSDISMGGLSFFMKISKEETARKFLGRNLRMQFVLPACEAQDKISRNGKVVGVQYHLSSDYSIHVKFDKNLSEEIIETAAEKNDTGREAGMDDDL